MRVINPTLHHRKRKSRIKTITDIFVACAPSVVFLSKVIDKDGERFFGRTEYSDVGFKSVAITRFLHDHYPKEVAKAEAELEAAGWRTGGSRTLWRRPDEYQPKTPRLQYRLSAAILEERRRRSPNGDWWIA